MDIFIGRTAGFCMGVKRAIESAKEETKKAMRKNNILFRRFSTQSKRNGGLKI